MGIESLLQQNMQNAGLAGSDRLARNAMFPQGQMDKTQYSTPSQLPTSAETIRADYDAPTNAYTGLPTQPFARGGIASIPRFADGGGPESEGKVFVGDENSGRWVDPSELNPTPQEPAKPPTMAELADQIKSAYRTNQNYDQLWKQFAAMKESDPQQWYKHELGFLGGQQGWQIGQNTSERNAALEPQLQNTIADAKKAGLSEDEINSILGSSRQEGNLTNQRRIAEEAAKGKGWVNQNIPGGWTTVAALAAAAAAPYALGAMGAGGAGALGAAEAGGALTTGELLGGAGGAFIPAAGSGASFMIPAGAYTAAGTGALTTGELLGGAGGAFTPTAGSGASFAIDPTAAYTAAEGLGGTAASQGLTLKDAYKAYNYGKKGLGIINALSGAGGQGTSNAMYGNQGINNPYAMQAGFNPGPVRSGLGIDSASTTAASPWSNLTPNIMLSKLSEFAPEYSKDMAAGGIAQGGGHLGGYSDGGRLLKGPGDGMSDNIPATIGDKQPARLAEGEFVVPADVVSHLGNGSTDAGAKQLYKMMDRIRKARTGNPKQGKQINPDKFTPKG